MRKFESWVVLAAVAWSIGTPALAGDWRAPRVVVVNCSGCHGVDGNTDSATAPRLAAQSAGYLTAQMNAYRLAASPPTDVIPFLRPVEKAGARSNEEARRSMIGPAQSIDTADIKAAADWYAQQAPAPGTPAGNAVLAARGAKIYAEGLPDDGVSACAGCHGPKAAGRGDQFPRLAGQHADYLIRQLILFTEGKRTAATIGVTAHALVRVDMKAVAEYLQQL
jgi:cytochrome c553